MRRSGGLLLAIPSGFLAPSALVAAQGVADNSLLGPSKSVHLPMCVLDEQGEEQSLDMEVPVLLLIDVGEEAVALLQEYTGETEAAGIFPYVPTQPDALPMAEATLVAARLWLSEVDSQRMAFLLCSRRPRRSIRVGGCSCQAGFASEAQGQCQGQAGHYGPVGGPDLDRSGSVASAFPAAVGHAAEAAGVRGPVGFTACASNRASSPATLCTAERAGPASEEASCAAALPPSLEDSDPLKLCSRPRPCRSWSTT